MANTAATVRHRYALLISAAAFVWLALVAIRLVVDVAPDGQPPPTPAPTPSVTWYDYTNAEHGIALRYPSLWVQATATPPDVIAAWETPDTKDRLRRGRVQPERRYTLSIRAYPTLADLPLAQVVGVQSPTIEKFFKQVPTVAAQGERSLGGRTWHEYIANPGGQYYALLTEHRGRIYVIAFERKWTKARFDATTWERQALETLAFTNAE